jgi:midasin (ATPase involved in ribosome maturation)
MLTYAYIPGSSGHWLLLDEVNLAPAETLERLAGTVLLYQ